jgi:BirA family transcriptional regulator, biotin operon repressor / biotin---[acetyl-CoA-carboxylase] ligase
LASWAFNQGGRVIASKLSIDLVSLQHTVAAARQDVMVDWVETTTSTNQALADDTVDQQHYRVLGADTQTAGRGRRQRPWLSVSGHCLTFSLRLPRYQEAELEHLSSLPLVVGLAITDAIESWALQHRLTLNGGLALKWPNDVLCNQKKVAGILIESKAALVVGIGINVFLSPQLQQSLPKKMGAIRPIEPGGLLCPSLMKSADAAIDATTLANLVARVVLSVLNADERHRADGLQANVERWNDMHLFHGQEVCLSDADQVLQQGVVQGIGRHGELLLLDRLGQVHRVLSGDLSLRQAPS